MTDTSAADAFCDSWIKGSESLKEKHCEGDLNEKTCRFLLGADGHDASGTGRWSGTLKQIFVSGNALID